MMPLWLRRKTRGMEKVENLYRTAPVQNDSIDTPEQFGSRLRDAMRAVAASIVRYRPLATSAIGIRNPNCSL
jgi:hypothetical protein